MKKSRAILEFKVEKPIYNLLSKNEKKILPLLIKACNELANIYLEQEKNYDIYQGSNLYPHTASAQQIQKAAKKDPLILSPYTVVEKSPEGLMAVPYHVKFQDSLQKICKLLSQASRLADNKSFATYLKVASLALLNGDYKKMDIAWLKIKDSTLQFLIGPYERNLDRRYFIKMSYLACIGVRDPYYTNKSKQIRDILLTNVSEKPHRYTSAPKFQISAVRNIYAAGFLATALISTEHIPSDDQTIREYGSRLVGYLSSMDYKFEKYLYPIFKQIFETRFRESYSEDSLRKANYYLMLVYGLARQLHRYEGSREELKELFPVFDELNSMLTGIAHSKHLVLKGAIDQKELEAMIIMHICWAFSEWVFAKTNHIRADYLRGDTMALNFYFQSEALREFQGISWPNFSKIFFAIEHLSAEIIRLISSGTYQQAQKFLKENLSYEVFKAFDSKLSKIKPS